jgi:hypothetical protein
MEFEIERSRTTQLIALMLTIVVIGGGIMWAMSAA